MAFFSPTVPGPAFSALGGGPAAGQGGMSDDDQRAMLANLLVQRQASPYQSVGMAVSGGQPRPMPMQAPPMGPPVAPVASQAAAQSAAFAPRPVAPAPNANAAAQAQANYAARQAAPAPAAPHPSMPPHPAMGRLGQAVARGRMGTPGAPRGPMA